MLPMVYWKKDYAIRPASLLTMHKSKPYNPLIAGMFFRSGQIDNGGAEL